jgi:gamma-glutamyltranspeptidase/glutathione hydrolase
VISAQHPHSLAAGREILDAGGSAVDAAVAMSVVDTVVQPGTSTLGGHLTLLVHNTTTGVTETLNGGFVSVADDHDPFDRVAERTSGRAVVVPGIIAGLEAAWRRYGKVPWARLWESGIRLARDGFAVSEKYRLVARSRNREVGDFLVQDDLAATLARVATDGAAYVYQGRWAENLVAAVRARGGRMTTADLAGYQAVWGEPEVGTYLGREIRVAPPPQYGGSVVLKALEVAEALDLHNRPPRWESPDSLYDEIQAMAGAITARHRGTSTDEIVDRITRRVPIGSPGEPPRGSHSVAARKDDLMVVATHSVAALPWGDTGITVGGIALNSARYLQPAALTPGDRLPEGLAVQLVLGNPTFAATAMGSGLHGCLLQNTVNVLGHGLSLPEAVTQDRWGYYTIDYTTLKVTNAVQVEPFTPELLDGVEALGQPLARADAQGRPYARRDKPRPGHVFPVTMGYWTAVDDTGVAVVDPRMFP